MPAISLAPHEVDLVLLSGNRSSLEDPYLPGKLRLWFPKAEFAGGESAQADGIAGLQGLALSFGKAQVESIYRSLQPGEDPWTAGWETGRRLDADDLKVVLLFGAGSPEICRSVTESMLEAFGPCPPLVCPGWELTGKPLPVEGGVVLSSAGLFRRGFLAVGIFGSRIEAGGTGLATGSARCVERSASPGRHALSFPEKVLSLFKAAA